MNFSISKIQMITLLSPLLSLSCMQASLESIQSSSAPLVEAAPTVTGSTDNSATNSSPAKIRTTQISQEDEELAEGTPTKPVPPASKPTVNPVANRTDKTIEQIILEEELKILAAKKAEQRALALQGNKSSVELVQPLKAGPSVALPTEPGQPATVVLEPTLPKIAPIPRIRPPGLSLTPEQVEKDMTGPGVLKPTVYYFAVINEDKSKCERNTNLHGAGGKVILTVCAKTRDACSLQGSCAVVQKGVTHTLNISGSSDGQDRYFKIDEDGCRFGYGVKSSCLDPFYTLAADLSLYRPGEVIFVPKVVGTTLPDGSSHSGYFVIRDRGRGIKGTGRFDFFSGSMSWRDRANPFNQLGLGDKRTNLEYFRVGGKTAAQVLKHRSFPNLPAHLAVSPSEQ